MHCSLQRPTSLYTCITIIFLAKNILCTYDGVYIRLTYINFNTDNCHSNLGVLIPILEFGGIKHSFNGLFSGQPEQVVTILCLNDDDGVTVATAT